jgi:predicted DNA-binding transcriptional regulator YafY
VASKRLVADRLRRVWAIVEYVAYRPGCTRRDLAQHFAIAERTLQADLNTIRQEMGLPLMRRGGYRFSTEDDARPVPFGLDDAHLLAQALRRVAMDGLASTDAVRSLTARLPLLFPPHLRPLLSRALGGSRATDEASPDDRVFGVLAQALQRRAPLRLRYLPDPAARLTQEAVVRPEVVVPYLGGWYLIGECQQTRKMRIVALEAVEEASIAAGWRAR